MAFKDKLRGIVDEDGRTQEQIEEAGRLAKGYLSRLLRGQREPGTKVLRKLASALNVPVSAFDDTTDQGERTVRIPGLRPTMQQLPGYADAEIMAARADPSIPIEVLRQVREVSFATPPTISPQLIIGLARLLSERTVSAVEETDEIRQRIVGKRSNKLLPKRYTQE